MATDVAFLIAAYGALLALGLQLVFVGTTTAIARRYAGVTGLALGVAYAGPGIGVALALPIAAGLIPELGWRAAAVGFAGLSLVALPFVLAHDQRPGSGSAGRRPRRRGRTPRARRPEACTRLPPRARSPPRRSLFRRAAAVDPTPSAGPCGLAAS